MPAKGHRKPMSERLYSKVERIPESGCWVFMGKVDADGYGMLSSSLAEGKKYWKAHRVSYEESKGAIPDGLEVAHKCNVRCCINPDHLYAATHRQNIDDRMTTGRQVRGEASNLAKLTEEQVREFLASAEHPIAWAKRIGVSRSHGYRIKSGINWGHLNGGEES
jgi:HNH endonuclease